MGGRRGFKVEMKKASEGEEAGIKSATFIARGENAYQGCSRRSAASTGSCGSRRSTPRSGATPRLPSSTSRRSSTTRSTSTSTRRTCESTPTARRTAATARQQADSAVRITHLPSGIVVQCQNERSQAQNKATAMRLLRARLLEEEEQRAEDLATERGEQKAAEWGSRIRSARCPSTRVKDHRTGHSEVGDAQQVLDGRPRRLRPRVPAQVAGDGR